MKGRRFSIGIRNSHDKSIHLGLTSGLRVFVCSNMAFSGGLTTVLAKHSKSFNLIDTLGIIPRRSARRRLHPPALYPDYYDGYGGGALSTAFT